MKQNNLAIGFERVSSNKQFQEGSSLEFYRNQIDFFANKSNYKIVKHFPFVATSAKQDKEVLDDEKHYVQQMISYCLENKVSNIIIPNIQRITRSGARWYLYLKEKIVESELNLIDTENVIQPKRNSLEYLGFEYDWSTYSPSESAEVQAAEEAKKNHHDLLSKLIRSEIEYTMKGYPMRAPPLGYKNQRITTADGSRVEWVADGYHSELIKKCFSLLSQGYDWNFVTDRVNKLGFLSKKKTRWGIRANGEKYPIGEIKQKPLTVKQLQKYIRNPRYVGFLKEKWTKDELVKGFIEPLVSIEDFNLANKGLYEIIKSTDGNYCLIHNPKNLSRCKRHQKDNPKFPCKFMSCPICGTKLLGSAGRNKNSTYIGHYHCNRNHKYWGINKEKFHSTLFEYIETLKLSPDFINLFKTVLDEVQQQKQIDGHNNLLSITSKIKELRIKEQSLIEKIGIISSPIVINGIELQIEENHKEIVLLEKQLQEDNSDTTTETNKLIEYCFKYLEHPKEYLESIDNNPNQRKLLELVFDQPPTPLDVINGTPKLSELYQLNQLSNSSKDLLVTLRRIELRLAE